MNNVRSLILFFLVASVAALHAAAPTVTSPTVTNIAATSATLGGNVTSDGGLAITARGVVWALTATNPNPQLGGTGVSSASTSGTTGVFTIAVSPLGQAKGYTFAAYATNSAGTSYSPTASFTSLSNNANLSALVVNTATLDQTFASNTTAYTASVPYSTSSVTVTPTRANANATITVNGTAVASGTPSGSIALTSGATITITIVVTAQDATTKTYTVAVTRAAGAPTVTTPTATNIGTTGATLGGNVTSDGGSAITARGMAWALASVNPAPQLGGTGVSSAVGSGTTGVFAVSAIGLTAGGTYVFAAYASNSVGTSYSGFSSFITSAPPASPAIAALPSFTSGSSKTISWNAVSGATSYTIQISAVADFSIGVVTQTASTPSATFASLNDGTTYYYRVLASNSFGSSSYSNVVSSTQDATAPSIAIVSPASGSSTTQANITVQGTSTDALSGVAGVRLNINGATVSTSNGFATWTATVPLGFGTNAITATATDNAGNTTTTAPVIITTSATPAYNPLVIPDTITGTTFNLNLSQKTKQFRSGVATTTYAYNNALFWGPTLIMNKGDWVQMNVTNNLIDTTTTHWHGFHIPAIMDGGPHQTIPPGTTWSPSFKVDNNAGTYWYHPHLHQFTQEQVTRGAGGLIIIRDPQEAALNLPRTYGVDDFPLVMTSRRFVTTGASANQFVTVNSAYGDYMLVNGTMNPQASLPAQYVRLRLLNAEIERSYTLGFSDNRTFYLIATDGGLVNAPVPLTRLVLGVGERVELLVNLTADTVGSSLDLMSYNAGIAGNSYPGSEPNATGPFGSLLNNIDFKVLHINVTAPTGNPVTTQPAVLASSTYWTDADVTNTRTLVIDGGGAVPYTFNSAVFSPNVNNQTLNLNAVEKWVIVNNSNFTHLFHIHDVQFNLVSRTGGTGSIAPYEVGWKDVCNAQKNSTVSFIAKFDGFASNTNPFMYHCHFSNHEDEGLMGQFAVVNNAVEKLAIASFTRTGNNSLISLDFNATPGTTYTLQYSPDMTTGSWIDIGSVTSDGSSANFSETDTARLGQARGFYRVTIPTIP